MMEVADPLIALTRAADAATILGAVGVDEPIFRAIKQARDEAGPERE